MARELFIGLMSGTSLDGIDAALVDFSQAQPLLIDTFFTPYDPPLKAQLFKLFTPGDNEIDSMGSCCTQLGNAYAEAVNKLLLQARCPHANIKAIGCHGQTIRHRPDWPTPFSLQIGDPNIIAHRTKITTLVDFRRRDLASGGQGAPLAPAFHHEAFHSDEENRVILNIGGISNISWVPKNNQEEPLGFDTGPGNSLLDLWCAKHLNKPYDNQGEWAATGHISEELLDSLLSESFFLLHPPKSTGKELFNAEWLEPHLNKHNSLKPEDIQATLLELTARSVSVAIKTHCPKADSLYVCGGGAHNQTLMKRLASLSGLPAKSTSTIGIDPDWVEAIAFAWLARQTLSGLTGNVPAATGANESVILGGIYPA